MEEVMDVIAALIEEGENEQAELGVSLEKAERQAEDVVARLAKATAYENARLALVKNEAQEKEICARLDTANRQWAAAQETLPRQEELARQAAQLELLLPSYDELDMKAADAARKEGEQRALQIKLSRAQENCDALTQETARYRQERQLLESVGEEKERLLAGRRTLEEERAKLRELYGNLARLGEHIALLEEKKRQYIAAQEQAEQKKRLHDGMHKAFLDEQAGIMASTLKANMPCPVCGSTAHPRLAVLSAKAPTEADVKRARQAMDVAVQAAEEAARAASTQRGIADTAKEAACKEVSLLLGDTPLEQAQEETRRRGKKASADIQAIEGQLAQIEEKEKRRAQLDLWIPQREEALALAQKETAAAGEGIAALAASLLEAGKQIAQLRAKLNPSSRAEALQKKAALESEQRRLKAEMDRAQKTQSECKEQLAGVRASIVQLQSQLAEEKGEDAAALEAAKTEILRHKAGIAQRQKDVHACLTANRTAQKNIRAKAQKMAQLEARYAWMKALSETANGNLAGKEKVMLETYIQTTYFDRILRRANIRLQKMSGGQYDLKRRRAAGNRQSQSGLELDIIDHVNGTERSVNTLSGGEAFLASLALALGLSDEVQTSTGIRLDTLFVDEGFGSLDSEALSKAYHTLAGLTQGNRLVGVISHVSELKERIDRQIVVTKQKSGGSRADIVV